MTKDEVKRILRAYRTSEDEIRLYRNRLAEIEDECYSPIHGIRTYDDLAMPRGGSPGDSTAAAALAAAEPWEAGQIREHIAKLEQFRQKVFNAIKGLPYYEKMVVYRFYLDGAPWYKVADEIGYSEKQCGRLRDAAMARLGKSLSGVVIP